LRALVLGEVRQPSAADAARSAGASDYLPLPDLGSVGVAEVGDRITEFCGRVCATLCRTDQPAAVRGRRGNGSVRVSDPLSLLRGLIGEMHSEQHSEIALLVLRLAAEYFERGVLFALENGQAYGIGAFGPEAERGSSALIEQRIRGAVLPVSEGSMLHDSVRSRATLQGPVPPKPANAPLLDRLGPPAPVEAALLPLLSGSEVFGLLFGDNPRSGRPVGDLKALEIFLSQAGMALQNALLKRRLGDLPAPDDARTGSERTNT
jgi:hypothetical protein